MSNMIGTFDADDFIRRYISGESLAALAKTAHIDYRDARRILVDRGIAIRSKAESAHRKVLPTSDIVRLYQDGTTVKDIARQYSVSEQIVSRALLEAGIVITRFETMRRRTARLSDLERAALGQRLIQNRDELAAACKRAITNEQRQLRISHLEHAIGRWLSIRNVEFSFQRAVGPYNIDIALPPIAVEVFGGSWHADSDRVRHFNTRAKYLFDRNWSILVIWHHISDYPVSERAADDVVAFANALRSDPSRVREYRVIRGDGELVSAGCYNGHDISVVSPSRRRKNT